MKTNKVSKEAQAIRENSIKYASPRTDEELIFGLVSENEKRGTTSAEITRLTSGNKYKVLTKLEKMGLIVSIPTGRRDRGRRWFDVDLAPQWVLEEAQ